jgi:protein-tyrosine-phosphatase
MLNVVAVCSGNTCRSPLFCAALRLLSDNVSVRTACAPNWKEEDDSRPWHDMPMAFADAANQLIQLGVVNSSRQERVAGLVFELDKHRKTAFEELEPQPTGNEVFVAAARKHVPSLKAWVNSIGRANARIEVIGISDFAWKVWDSHRIKKETKERGTEMDMETETRDAYRALATLMILRGCEMFPALNAGMTLTEVYRP